MKKSEIKNDLEEAKLFCSPIFKNYRAYTLVRAIAKYSDNPVCNPQALEMLELGKNAGFENLAFEIRKESMIIAGNITRQSGSFMSAIYQGDFKKAWSRADMGNKEALWTALGNDEIEL
jgi:hypothetical protein